MARWPRPNAAVTWSRSTVHRGPGSSVAMERARYGELLAVAGGRERLLHDMESQPLAPPDAVQRFRAASAHPPIRRTSTTARSSPAARYRCAAASASCSRTSPRPACRWESRPPPARQVAALLGAHLGEGWLAFRRRGVCGTGAAEKAPIRRCTCAPQALGLSAEDALAIEDSPAGIAAARAAGIAVVVARSLYFADIDAALPCRPGRRWAVPAAGSRWRVRRVTIALR